MKDSHGRTIDYLRISLTDRCNFRCIYCMPEEGVQSLAHEDILRIEEIEEAVRVAAGMGIRSIRLTGGEPLVRLGVVDLVRAIAHTPGIENVSMTTNGVLLPKMAADLKDNRFDVAVGGITRSPARALTADFLPAYAPFGKVALVNVKMKNKFRTLDDLNQPDVRVIKNPGGTNEAFVLANLTRAKVSTHDKNFEIPGLIAEGRGDVMITENAEAKLYAKKDKRLHAAFLENPLTPVNYMGFMLPVDDPDYTRVMNYLWDLLDRRGELKSIEAKWLD